MLSRTSLSKQSLALSTLVLPSHCCLARWDLPAVVVLPRLVPSVANKLVGGLGRLLVRDCRVSRYCVSCSIKYGEGL